MTQLAARSPSQQLNIVVLFCQHCVLAEALGRAEHSLDGDDGELTVKLAPVACSTQVELPHLFTLLEQGADGVSLVRCEQKACRFLVGGLLSDKRLARAQSLLDEAGMGGARLTSNEGLRLTTDDLLAEARRCAEGLRPFGPSPMRKE